MRRPRLFGSRREHAIELTAVLSFPGELLPLCNVPARVGAAGSVRAQRCADLAIQKFHRGPIRDFTIGAEAALEAASSRRFAEIR